MLPLQIGDRRANRRRRFLVIALTLTVLMFINTQTSRLMKTIREGGVVSPSPPNFDYFVLAETWVPSYRKNNPCRDDIVTGFYIHGLWPSRSDGNHPVGEAGKSNFESMSLGRLLLRLRRHWPHLPSKAAGTENIPWTKQYEKHGVCSGFKTFDYFKLTLDIFEEKNVLKILAEGGVEPKNSLQLEFSKIKEAVTDGFGAEPLLVCDDVNGESYLLEVRLCLTLGENNTPIYKNCKQTSTCRRLVHFPES